MSSTVLAVAGTIMVAIAAVMLLLATLRGGQEAAADRQSIRDDLQVAAADRQSIRDDLQAAAADRQSIRDDLQAVGQAAAADRQSIRDEVAEGFKRTDALMEQGFTEIKDLLNGRTDETEASVPASASSRGQANDSSSASSRGQAPLAAKPTDAP